MSWHKQRYRTGTSVEYSDKRCSPLIAGVLLIHRDTTNSAKSSRWLRRGEDSEPARCKEERYRSKNPRMSQETYIMLTRALLFALQQGHCSKHTHTRRSNAPNTTWEEVFPRTHPSPPTTLANWRVSRSVGAVLTFALGFTGEHQMSHGLRSLISSATWKFSGTFKCSLLLHLLQYIRPIWVCVYIVIRSLEQ